MDSAAHNQEQGGQDPNASESQVSENKLRMVSKEERDNLELILDIPLKVSVELGRAKILVDDLIQLHKGSVLELDKIAGDPLDILINDRIVARGEVIVVNEKFGIRLTDIVSHTDRIRQLGE